MPELPEVETVVRDLNQSGICGCRIKAVTIKWPRTIDGSTPEAFTEAVRGKTIKLVQRRGKYIIIHLCNENRIYIHLRMTGKLQMHPKEFQAGKHDHVVFTLNSGRQLVFNDTRKFGRITMSAEVPPNVAALGPEPLEREFTKAWLQAALSGKSRAIKPLLLDQSFIAGLGNIYVDEALWQARIHPERNSRTITHAEADGLHRAIRTVLKRGIKNSGTTLGNGESNFYSVAGHRGRNADQLKVFRRDGEPCPACGTTIQRLVVGQRGTHICPQCQG
ncbi:MAG: bifunctional DNA-formamidopyrimidine glycosylase/DNA-(apurinic or apyrimidinic site) lyase [Kiritimatiellae bacterium]|nr:bifunctional DNA-formamidopyrimidine glycosylase/DNA-(apurinic or apyrimidinic site) lyase [Kiritimatiellia bacterium]